MMIHHISVLSDVFHYFKEENEAWGRLGQNEQPTLNGDKWSSQKMPKLIMKQVFHPQYSSCVGVCECWEFLLPWDVREAEEHFY